MKIPLSNPQSIQRLLFIIAGAIVLAWSMVSPDYRDSEGNLIGTVCLPVTVGIALFLIGILIETGSFKYWLALLLVGQGFSLQMIDAGKSVGYQHYRSIIELLSQDYILIFTLFLLQAAFVVSGIIKNRTQILKWMEKFKRWQLIIVGLLIFLTSATVSADVKFYFYELIFASVVLIINLGNFILVILSMPEQMVLSWEIRFDRLLAPESIQASRNISRIDLFITFAALWVFMLSSLLNLVSYQRHPHIADEVIYLYQSEFVANGSLKLPAPPSNQAFNLYLMQFAGDEWYPVTPVGWPAMLSIGTMLGVSWLVNPFLAGINLFLVYFILRELYSQRFARVVILLLCLSPWYILMGMNYMPHIFTLTCVLFAVLCIIHARKTNRFYWALAAGISLGMVSLIRPLDGLMMAGLLGVWAIGIGGARLKLTSIITLVLGTAVVAAVVLPYNKALTGDPLIFPINQYLDARFGVNSNAYGFGPDRGMGWPIDPHMGHSPIDGVINSDLNTYAVNIELFGWSTGSLWLVFIFLISLKYRKSDYLMMGVICTVFIGYFFYFISGGPDFGARYWFVMIVPFVVLSVRGIQSLQEKFLSESESTLFGGRLMFGVILLSLVAMTTFLPWRAIDKYFHYLNMRPDIGELAEANNFGSSLVLIRGSELPDYASAFIFNPLDYNTSQPIYAWDRTVEESLKVLQAYVDRPVWLIDGPNLTGGGYRLIAGPIPALRILSGEVNIPLAEPGP